MKINLIVCLLTFWLYALVAAEDPPAEPAPAEESDDKDKKKEEPKFIQKGWLQYLQTKIGGPKLP